MAGVSDFSSPPETLISNWILLLGRQSMVTGKGLLKDSGNQVQIPGDVGSLVFASEEVRRRRASTTAFHSSQTLTGGWPRIIVANAAS